MELSTMKKILDNLKPRQYDFKENYKESERYYLNQNDITEWNQRESKVNSHGKDKPLRKADNRVSSNFLQLLIDQESGYVATNKPQIDVGEDTRNDHIRNSLGDDFAVRLNQLVVDASLAGKGWLHYWYDSKDNSFQYGIVPPDQVTAIYTSDLNQKLSAVVRQYNRLDTNTGDSHKVIEYWDDEKCTMFQASQPNLEDLNYYNGFNTYDISTGDESGTTAEYPHNFGAIPFIEFDKNKYQRPELYKIKGHVDIYDKIYNGFANDLDDVQESIITLKGYGGANLQEFLETLKEDKAIKLDEDGEVGNLQIDIPTDAREKALQIARDNIFISGQGIDPKEFNAKSATSGTAIKMFYSHLELKAGTTEQYFKLAISELVRAILRHGKFPDANEIPINQVWQRAQVSNTLEQAQTLNQVASFTSDKSKAKYNPVTSDDYQAELEEREKEAINDPYSNPEALNNLGGNNGNE